MKTVSVKNITDLIEEEFGEFWYENPYCLTIYAIQMGIFDECVIKTQCHIAAIEWCIEYKRKGTVNGKKFPTDFNEKVFNKLTKTEEYEF